MYLLHHGVDVQILLMTHVDNVVSDSSNIIVSTFSYLKLCNCVLCALIV